MIQHRYMGPAVCRSRTRRYVGILEHAGWCTVTPDIDAAHLTYTRSSAADQI